MLVCNKTTLRLGADGEIDAVCVQQTKDSQTAWYMELSKCVFHEKQRSSLYNIN